MSETRERIDKRNRRCVDSVDEDTGAELARAVVDGDIAAGGQSASDDLRSKNVARCRDTGIS